MSSEKVGEEVSLSENPDRVIMDKVEIGKKLIEDLKRGYNDLLKTFNIGQKLISVQIKVPENLNELTSQLEEIAIAQKAQSEIYAKMAISAQRNKILATIGMIFGIIGITLAFLI